MAYLATGFTPEEEKQLLAHQRRLAEFAEEQERIRKITLVATVAGFLYTLANFAKLAASLRKKGVTT